MYVCMCMSTFTHPQRKYCITLIATLTYIHTYTRRNMYIHVCIYLHANKHISPINFQHCIPQQSTWLRLKAFLAFNVCSTMYNVCPCVYVYVYTYIYMQVYVHTYIDVNVFIFKYINGFLLFLLFLHFVFFFVPHMLCANF